MRSLRTLARKLGPVGTVALVTLLLIVVSVIVGPFIWTVDPDAMDLRARFKGPGVDHPLGTDDLGRDLLSRILNGGRITLFGAAMIMLGTTVIAFTIGAAAGAIGGKVDAYLSRAIDALLALPGLVVALALVGILGKSFPNLLVALVVSTWPWYARAYRGIFLAERHKDYTIAAKSIGAPTYRVVFRHIVPNVAGPALVMTTVNFGAAMLGLSGLSFLGLGAQPPAAEWGTMINAARGFFQTDPWLIVVPGAAIGVTVLSAFLLGDALRDWVDPQYVDQTRRIRRSRVASVDPLDRSTARGVEHTSKEIASS